jgi:hypothetical protein
MSNFTETLLANAGSDDIDEVYACLVEAIEHIEELEASLDWVAEYNANPS